VKGETVSPPKKTALAIKALGANYGVASGPSIEKEFGWEKPPKGKLKLNVDASYFADGLGAAVTVLRNDKGEAIAGMACPLVNMLSATFAEATALLRGLEFLEDIGCDAAVGGCTSQPHLHLLPLTLPISLLYLSRTHAHTLAKEEE
jgi:hypothetical protein